MDKILSKTYFSIPEGYRSVNSLYRQAKKVEPGIKQKDVKEWLEKQYTYTIHKPARRNYARNKVIVSAIDEQWQADLVDMQNLTKYNDNSRYLLTCIDLFSKFAWAIPLKSKFSDDIIEAFNQIFQSSNRKPYKLQTDAGKEFVNKGFQKFLKYHDIEFFTTNSEMKASVVERFNRTLKERMWKIFTHHNTYKYLPFLPNLLQNYNNSIHRTIGMAPSQVNEKNSDEIRRKVFKLVGSLETKFKFNVGDKVRISKVKRLFEKGYTPNWTEEYFIIHERFNRVPPVYTLKDLMNEQLSGIFYEPELQKVQVDDLYIVEKIVKTRKRNNKTEYFVKWRGYPEKFNSWVSDIDKIVK